MSKEVAVKTIHEVLMTAPPAQVTRCKIAMVEIAHGHWDAAALTMEDAIRESEPGEWALDCMQIRDFCMMMDRVKCQGIGSIGKKPESGADQLVI
ncbi:hypothetical protein SAMN05216316_0287 [Nitrosovibrio sp. Nv6]|nr:hypothetical protein SAMN05216316_0287 [Nitrosovibrio sp. Nv6]